VNKVFRVNNREEKNCFLRFLMILSINMKRLIMRLIRKQKQ
jgi:hypothetical protein